MLHLKKKESMDSCENLVIHSEFLKYNMYINVPLYLYRYIVLSNGCVKAMMNLYNVLGGV